MLKTQELEKVIGYQFKQPERLRQALTHSSYANEKHLKKQSDNERLEFLGDAVLELVSSEYLFNHYAPCTPALTVTLPVTLWSMSLTAAAPVTPTRCPSTPTPAPLWS